MMHITRIVSSGELTEMGTRDVIRVFLKMAGKGVWYKLNDARDVWRHRDVDALLVLEG
jgi:hypothetical protein